MRRPSTRPRTPARSGIALAALAGLAWSAVSARRARSGAVTAAEERVFRRFNDAPGWIEAPAWLVMQAGSLGAVAVTAAVQARRGPTAAAWTGVVGTAVWAGVKGIKPMIGRGRPDDLLDGVRVRGRRQTGLGYPSGHAAVAMTLACAVRLDRHPVGTGLAVAGVVGATRLYVGAHLPLDVVGGVAIGAVAGCGAVALRGGSAAR